MGVGKRVAGDIETIEGMGISIYCEKGVVEKVTEGRCGSALRLTDDAAGHVISAANASFGSVSVELLNG
jgi:predicted DNA-binding transcriptional regulator YafY